MKTILTLVCLSFMSLTCKQEPVEEQKDIEKTEEPTTAVERHGQLKVQGGKIVDQHGQPVQLRGMSFFWSQWIGKYYTPETVKWLKDDWYCNVVRVAMAVEAGGYLSNPAAEKQKVFAVVDAAIAEGIYVIIDWHDHQATSHLLESKKFFAEMAKKYGQTPNVIYETFNEPLQISWSNEIKPYHRAVIDTIRVHDPDNLIICGTSTWSQDVDVAANDPLTGTNIAYALHFYSGTHKQSLRNKASAALSKGVALFVTEFGSTDSTGDGVVNTSETNTWWKFCDDNGLSWCNWSVADKNESSAALIGGASTTGGWQTRDISESGRFVRAELRAKNLNFR